MNALSRTIGSFLALSALSVFHSVATAQTCGSGGGATLCLSATGTSSNIQLNWTVSGTITAIEVYRDITSDPSGGTRLTSLAVTPRSDTDSPAVTGTRAWSRHKF